MAEETITRRDQHQHQQHQHHQQHHQHHHQQQQNTYFIFLGKIARRQQGQNCYQEPREDSDKDKREQIKERIASHRITVVIT
jgi:hypothetical protein